MVAGQPRSSLASFSPVNRLHANDVLEPENHGAILGPGSKQQGMKGVELPRLSNFVQK